MALKPQRQIIYDDISYVMDVTGVRGGIVCATATSSGVFGPGLDSSNRKVSYATDPSGLPAVGLLLNDVVNLDLSRQHLNQYKDEVQITSKVTLGKKGTVSTNHVVAGSASGSITLPAVAYCGPFGRIATGAGYAVSGYPVVGRVLTALDSEGYCQVDIDL